MKHMIIIFLMLAFIAASVAEAQSPNPNQYRTLAATCHRLMLKADNSTELEQSEQLGTAQQKQQQFALKTEKFVAAWTALAKEYSEKGTFNVKKAKQVSKTFHDLEK